MWREPALVVMRRELGAHARGTLAWWLPLAAMLALACALQPQLAGGVLAAKLEAMPVEMRRAFGLALLDFHRPAAYLAANFLAVSLGTGLLAARLGAVAVSREEAQRTAELLYALPVTRARILAGKAGAVAAYAIGFPLALALASVPVLAAVSERPLELGLVAQLFAGAAAAGLCLGGVGMLIGACLRDARAAGGLALLASLGVWLLGLLSALAPATAPLGWLSPYRHVEPVAIVSAGGLDPLTAAALVAVGAAAAALAVARYRRRDILA